MFHLLPRCWPRSLSLLFFLLRNFFACKFFLSVVVLNSCFLKRLDQPPLQFVEMIFFLKNSAKKRRHSSARIRGYMYLSTYRLEYGRHVARLRRRRRRAYAPTSNTASHDNHKENPSWVSFFSRDAYGAPLGGPSGRRSSAIIAHLFRQLHEYPDRKKR